MALVEKLQEKLLEFRLQALLLAIFAVLASSLLLLGPSFRTVVSFFWPLLLSTALFLGAVLVLRVISPPPTGALSDRAGEELMDYVAGCTSEEHQEAEAASGGDAEHEAAAAAAAAEGPKKSQ